MFFVANPPTDGTPCTHCLITQPAIPRNVSGATSTHTKPGLCKAYGSVTSTEISQVPFTLVSIIKADSFAWDDRLPHRACIARETCDQDRQIREGPLVAVTRDSGEHACPETSELRLASSLPAGKSRDSMSTLDHKNENRAEQVL